jgi:O-antigen/teichoic acid export membrane protein
MRVLRSLSSFVFNLVLARMLGAGGTGSYFLALGVTQLATQAARIGMDPMVVRLFAGGEGRSRVVYGRVLALVLVVGLLMTGMLLAAAPFLCVTLFGETALIEPLRIMALGIVPGALAYLHGSFLQSAGKIGLSILVHYVALFVTGIPFLLLAGKGGIEGAALAHVAASVSTLAIGVWLWRQTVDTAFTLSNHDLAPGRWREVVGASLSLCSIGLLTAASGLADTFLLGALGTIEDVGTFRVAFRIAVLGGAALEVVRAVIAPRMAAHYSDGDWYALERSGRAGTALSVLLTLPYWFVVLLFPRQVLGIFGSEFTAVTTATIILIFARMIATFTGPVGTLLAMTGLERPLRNLTIVVTVMRIVLLAAVIPVWGVLGVAVVGCLSEIVAGVAATVLSRQRLGIAVLPLPRSVLSYRADQARTH